MIAFCISSLVRKPLKNFGSKFENCVCSLHLRENNTCDEAHLHTKLSDLYENKTFMILV